MEFDAKKEVEDVVDFVKSYYKENSLGGAVIGLSGGKDSAVALAIMVKALGSENVVALSLPCHSCREDYDLAKLVAEHFNVKLYNLDLTSVNDEFVKSFGASYGNLDEKYLENSSINLKPRLRMASLYYYSAMLSSLRGKIYLVVGTGNKCEQYVGYFTKGGDSVCDISILADFTVDEVIALGEVLGVPKEVLYRTPSDGLSGKSDEEKLGVTYKEIAKVIKKDEKIDEKSLKKIEKLHKLAEHKFYIPTYRRETK